MFKFVLLVAFVGLAAAVDSDVNAEVKSLENDISPEGVFHYAFLTSNGIDVNSAGDANAINGAYQYVSPEGKPIKLSYVADDNGYHPSSDLLPTSPPIPPAIVRAVEYILAHPQAEETSRKLLAVD